MASPGGEELVAWTSEVQLHVGAPAACTLRLRRRFTHRGFQYFDPPRQEDPLTDAHARFAAYQARFRDEDLARAIEDSLRPHGLDSEFAKHIQEFVVDARGELLYEFSVWKDTIGEVSQRLLQLLDEALREEFGRDWRSATFASDVLFVHAHSKLGGAANHKFDLTPTLLRGKALRFEDVFLEQVVRIWEGSEEDEGAKRIDPADFTDFTAELALAHEACEPDAFGCRRGGRGAHVEITGLKARADLNGQKGFICLPVSLETQRWPVKVNGSDKPVLIRRCNLKLVNSHRAGEEEGSEDDREADPEQTEITQNIPDGVQG